jgi:hypothetical protein
VNKKNLLLAVVGFIFFAACSSQDEVISERNNSSSTINVQASLCKSNPENIKRLFSSYAIGTRSMGIPNKINNFNFDRAVTTYSHSKDFYIYMVPLKGTNTADSLLVGVGTTVGFLGLVPTAGASGVGMVVCTGLLSAVAC